MNATLPFSPTTATELRPSLAATLCAILAMTLLILTSGVRGWALPFCALALLGTHVTNWRWPRDAMAPVALRALLFVIIFFTADVSSINIDWIFRDSTVQFFGQLAAVELVLQHWRTRSGERYPAISLLLSCTVFLAACNVRYGLVPAIVPAVTPLFWVCLLWALRDWKPQQNLSASTCRSFSLSRVHFLTAIFLILSLTGGALLHRLGLTYREDLMRIGSNIVRQRDTVSLAGISDRPRLNSGFDARASTERVLKIEGSLSAPHLRAAAFDTYTSGSWSPPLSQRDLSNWDARQLASAQSGPRVRVTRLVDLQTNAVFAPLNSSGLIPDPSIGIDPIEVRGNRESGLLVCDENAPWGYQIIDNEQNIAGVPTHQGPLAAPLNSLSRAVYLQLPPDLDARVRQIAQTAAGDALTAPEQAENIAEYLMTNHKYSLSIELNRAAGDPLTQFLVEKKDAHCEFFAAAMTIMARLNGIPARYVVGYLAHESEFGSGGAVTVVRQRDAHAWSEIWLDGVGWVTADATPGGGRPDVLPNVSAWQRTSEWARDALENIRQRAVKIPKRTWFFIVAVPLALWFLIRVQPFRRAGRTAATRARDYASPDAQIAQLAPRFERWLARQGVTLTPALSWQRAFARHDLPTQRPDAALWLRDYERARFGADWEMADDLEARLRKIEAE